MNSVVTPAACACAAIDATLPPSEALMYQIHMPWPANAVPLAVVAVVVGGGATTDLRGRRVQLVGHDADRPVAFELLPPASITAMSPECAAAGTVTTRPSFEECRCAVGELRAMRAFHECGKATVWPLFRPLPPSSSVPCVET